MYVIDTNVLLDWWERRYPPDIFPAVKEKMEQLVAANKLIAPEGVRGEVNHVGSHGLKQWANNHRAIFLPHSAALQHEATDIQQRFPGFIDLTAIHDEADRWIVGLAKIKSCAVLSHETRARTKKKPPRSHYVPDVCDELAIKCVDFLQMMRAERWQF